LFKKLDELTDRYEEIMNEIESCEDFAKFNTVEFYKNHVDSVTKEIK
jgi:hypothetical protein